MGGPFFYNSIQPHKCRSRIRNPLINQYCSFCGLFISEDPSVVYLRPESFSYVNSCIGEHDIILTNMIKKQRIHLHYTQEASHISFRHNLVDWLERSARKLNLSVSTTHLSVAILDIVMSEYAIPSEKMEIMVFTALSIAGKMNDRDELLPCLKDVPVFFQKEMSVSELQSCEKVVFEVLDYSVVIQTPYQFASYFISCGVISNIDMNNKYAATVMYEFERMVSLFASSCLKNYELCKFESVVVGAAIVAGARKMLGFKHTWTKHLEKLTGITWSSIYTCFGILERTAIEVYGDELKVKELHPTPIKRKSTQALNGTEDKEWATVANVSGIDDKQVFVSRFSFSTNSNDEQLNCQTYCSQLPDPR